MDAAASGGSSNINGVLEPGERVTVSPSLKNLDGSAVDLSGHAGGLAGSDGTVQWVQDTEAVYGTVGAGTAVSCTDGSRDCYELEPGTPDQRPAQHWDLEDREVLSTGR